MLVLDSKPLVTVVMITYNQGRYLEDAINGVLFQQCDFEFEIIIADDCSSDNTEEIVYKFLKTHPQCSRIKYKRNTVNIGMQENFNLTIQLANGKYIALCEGDDYWIDPFKLKKQVDFLEAHKEFSLCFHPAKILMQNGMLVDEFEISLPKKFHQLEDMARFGNYIRTPTVIFRNILEENDLELLKKCPAGDFPLNLILGQYGDYGFLKDSMSVYRQGVGIWSTLNEKQSTLGFLITIIYSKEYFSNKSGQEEIINILNNGIRYFVNSIYSDLNSDDLKNYLLDNLVLRELLLSIITNKPQIDNQKKVLKLISSLRGLLKRKIKGLYK